ncbi:retrovirus-related pol polyprotein from transposon TNT 1-94 [Tanacetum coccineum]
MANLSEDIQCAGSDTRPPMLDKADFASWQQRIRLYCRGKENGVNILKSIDEGPFQMGTTRVIVAEGTEGSLNLGPERPRVYSDLSQDEKDRTVKMLLEGSELTKEDRESQLYDDFEHFRQNKGETIHDYYVRFAKLINDMRNIKMTMSKIQLNSKFVLNTCCLNGQYEAHANENKMIHQQSIVDRKHDEIERKNLLIEHDNIIADGLSKEVCYVASNSELNVSRFTEMQKAHNVVKARCLELEAELSNLRDNIHKDNYNELLNRFSNLEETRSELDRTLDFRARDFQISQLIEKVNGLQEQNELFRAENAKIMQHTTRNCMIRSDYGAKNSEQITALKNEMESKANYRIRSHVSLQIRSLASACRYTKHSQELLEYVFGTCPKVFNQQDKKHAHTPRKKQVTFEDQIATSSSTTHKHVEPMHTQQSNVPVPPSTGVNSCTDASGSQPRSILKKHKIPPAKSDSMKKVEEHPRTIRSSLKTMNRVDSSISSKRTVVQIVLWYLDSGCSKHMTGDRSRLMNFVKKFIGTVRFGNDHFGAIMGYGDYVVGDSVISRVYYVEGLGHNLFSVGQFCDSDLEVAFRKHSCYVRDTDGVELLKGSRGSNLYTISVEDMMKSSPICLLSKASKHKSWLWHRRLNHLNFGTINDLARKDLVRGLPRLKFEKDHLCSACQLGKSKKHTHKPKTENTNLEVLNTLHMDLCGPMRVQTINGKKYILVIVDDYSRFTWVKFLRSKDETPTVVIKFLKQIQVGLNKTVRFIRTDNGTEFVNKTLYDYYESVGIFHQKTVPRTPQQNGVVERQNRTLVEAARTMLIFSKAPMFLWAEAVATACYTQNRSLIHTRHDKTPYELVHNKKPDLTFFRVFGALCYPTNDSEDLGKLQPTADIGIFVGYAPSRKGYRIYNKRTRQIMETIHVQFDELTEQMAPVQSSPGPAPNLLTPGPISSGLVPNPAPAIPYVPPTNKELEMLFQPMFDEYFNPPGDADREVPVPETFHEQTDDELTEAEIKQMEADDQAIQTILLGVQKTSMLLLIVVKLLRKSGYVFNK